MQTVPPTLPPRPEPCDNTTRAAWRTFLNKTYGVPSKVMKDARSEVYMHAFETLSVGDEEYVRYLASLDRPPHKLNGHDGRDPDPPARRTRRPRAPRPETPAEAPAVIPRPLYTKDDLARASNATIATFVQDCAEEMARRLGSDDAARRWLSQFWGKVALAAAISLCVVLPAHAQQLPVPPPALQAPAPAPSPPPWERWTNAPDAPRTDARPPRREPPPTMFDGRLQTYR